MSIQIKIYDGQGLLLRCVTSVMEKDKLENLIKTFHVYIEKNHLFIVDNIWNSIVTKTYSYATDKSNLDKVREQAVSRKSRALDGICIDLTTFKASKYLKKRK